MNNRKLKLLFRFIIGCYTLLLFTFMIIGFGSIRRYTYSEYMYNLKPFATINQFLQFEQFNTDIWIINILGNIGVFIPLGILIPLAFEKKFIKSFYIFFISIFSLELIQLLSRRGSFDIDDMILNSLGFVCGYGIFIIISTWVISKRC